MIRVEGVHADGRPFFFGYVGNISETGMFVQTARPRCIGDGFRLRLHSRALRNEPIECSAEVIWVSGYHGVARPAMGIGLRFQDLDLQSAALLRRFCSVA